MIDSHTHSEYSADSNLSLEALIETAISKNIYYLAITDHLDRDFLFLKSKQQIKQIDLPSYAKAIHRVKKDYSGKIKLGFGIECGYSKKAQFINSMELSEYDFDLVINSIHTVNDEDIYLESYYINKTKDQLFIPYLEAINESLDAPYSYDIIGHIGYIARKAPFPFNFRDYDYLFDIILKKIIDKGKCLEVNTHVKTAPVNFFPGVDIIQRYKDLGGELITFSSDAHHKNRIGDKYDLVKSCLKSIGFNYLTYYIERKPHFFPI